MTFVVLCFVVGALFALLRAAQQHNLETPVYDRFYAQVRLRATGLARKAAHSPWILALHGAHIDVLVREGVVAAYEVAVHRIRALYGRIHAPVQPGLLLWLLVGAFLSIWLVNSGPELVVLAAAPAAVPAAPTNQPMNTHPADVFAHAAKEGELDDLLEERGIKRIGNWIIVSGRKETVMLDLNVVEDIRVLPRGKDVDDVVNTHARVRAVPIEGQGARVRFLFALLGEYVARGEGRGAVYDAVHSLIHWQTDQNVKVDCWGYTRVDTNGAWFLDAEEGHVFELTHRVHDAIRRHCALLGYEHRIVKVFDVNYQLAKVRHEMEKDVEAAIESAVFQEEFAWTADVTGMALRRDRNYLHNLQTSILPHYLNEGYTLIGGNPDSGILVFAKGVPAPKTADASARLARILLRGGMQLSKGPAVKAKLVDFSKHEGARDGIYMVLSRTIADKLARLNGFRFGATWQGHVYQPGRTAMKGMAIVATQDHPETDEMLGYHELTTPHIDAVVSLEDYRKIYGTGREGNVVTIRPQDIWVMEVDDHAAWGKLHVSGQVLRRAPKALVDTFQAATTELRKEIEAAVKSGDKRDLFPHLFGFGSVGRVIRAGLRPLMKAVYTTDEETGEKVVTDRVDTVWKTTFEKGLGRAIRKGWALPGAYVRLLYDSTLEYDEETGVADIAVPKALGLEEGDLIPVGSYPLLAALDELGRSAGVGTFRVARIHTEWSSNFVSFHPDVALAMLRDEDGDKLPIWKIAIGETSGAATCGIARISLSTKVESDETMTPMEAIEFARKKTIFSAELDGDPPADSRKVLAILSEQTSEIGVVDNMVTSAMLYLGDEVYDMVAPTGESAVVFFSKCTQAQIEGMKHVTHSAYSRDALMSYLVEVLDESCFDERGVLITHPEIALQKPKDEGGYRIPDPSLEDHFQILDGMVPEIGEELFVSPVTHVAVDVQRIVSEWHDEGFAPSDYYNEAAKRAYGLAKAWVRHNGTRINLGRLVTSVIQTASGIRHQYGFSAEKLYLTTTAVRLAAQLTRAEWIVAQVMSLMATYHGLHIPLYFCDPETLRVFGKWTEGEVEDLFVELGLDKRNVITKADKNYRKAELDAQADRGYISSRAYGPANCDFTEGAVEVAQDDEGRIVLRQGDLWLMLADGEDYELGSYVLTSTWTRGRSLYGLLVQS